MEFKKCKKCGQIVALVKPTGVPLVCCGEEMETLKPKTEEEGTEKHSPVYKRVGNQVIVSIGSTLHPSIKEHYIEWIVLSTNKGNQRKCLNAGEIPTATFEICSSERINEIYAYCNVHELWKLVVNEETPLKQ